MRLIHSLIGLSLFAGVAFAGTHRVAPCPYWTYDFESRDYVCRWNPTTLILPDVNELNKIVRTLNQQIDALERRIEALEKRRR